MTPRAYYNEFDRSAAAWLRQLIRDRLIADGDVDERSICDVRPSDLAEYAQCHFFAGIGGWSYALRLAGWPDGRRIWTGSCPCQPFSAAGKGLGEKDPRHLWPVFRRLIAECNPSAVFGEQVASSAGRLWLSRVRADLEGLGYAVGAADLCSAGVGSPNIRQRLYWVANSDSERRAKRSKRDGKAERPEQPSPRWADAHGCGGSGGLADADGGQPRHGGAQPSGQHGQQPEDGGAGRLGNAGSAGFQERVSDRRVQREAMGTQPRQAVERRSNLGFWSAYELLHCTDGKARRIEPGSFPLVAGLPGRVGLLRGYGNAINPEVAAEFIRACEEVKP